MRQGPPWYQSGGGPRPHAAGASVVPKGKEAPPPCGGGLASPNAEEAHTPMQRGPRWSQSGKKPLAHEAYASPVPMRRRPQAHVVGASVVPKRWRPPGPCGGGLSGPKVEEAL